MEDIERKENTDIPQQHDECVKENFTEVHENKKTVQETQGQWQNEEVNTNETEDMEELSEKKINMRSEPKSHSHTNHTPLAKNEKNDK